MFRQNSTFRHYAGTYPGCPQIKKSQARLPKHLAILSAILDYAALQQEDDSILEQYINDNPCKRVRSLKQTIQYYLSDAEN